MQTMHDARAAASIASAVMHGTDASSKRCVIPGTPRLLGAGRPAGISTSGALRLVLQWEADQGEVMR